MRKAFVFLMLILTPLLAACDGLLDDLFLDMALEWVASKNIVGCSDASGPGPDDCDFQVNWTEVAKYGVGYGKDPHLQDVVDTGIVARDIHNADTLAEEGFDNGDPDKILQAMKIRPHDWSYDQQLSVLILVDGDQQDSNMRALDSEKKVDDHVKATLNKEGLSKNDAQAAKVCASSYTNMYQHREAALLTQINKDANGKNVNANSIDQLYREVDLVRLRMSELASNPASGQCSKFGGN